MCFALSIFAALGISLFKDNMKEIIIFVIIIISCCIAALFINETSFVKINSMTGWDKYAGMGAQKEYLTTNALDNIDYFDKRNNDVIVLSDNKNVKIKMLNDAITLLEFKVSGLKDKENVKLELPRLYYLGYSITLTSNDNKVSNIDYKNGKNGFIEISVPQNGTIKISYVGTTLYRVAIIIRNVFIIAIILYTVYIKYKKVTLYKKNS